MDVISLPCRRGSLFDALSAWYQYLLYLIKKRPSEVLERFKQHSPKDVAISTITLFELEYGVEKSEYRQRSEDALAKFLLPLNLINLDRSSAIEAATIRAQLEKKGMPIGPYDLLSIRWISISAHYLCAVHIITLGFLDFRFKHHRCFMGNFERNSVCPVLFGRTSPCCGTFSLRTDRCYWYLFRSAVLISQDFSLQFFLLSKVE